MRSKKATGFINVKQDLPTCIACSTFFDIENTNLDATYLVDIHFTVRLELLEAKQTAE